MRKILLSLGAASLALAPVAASAGTRAGDIVPSATKVSHSVQSVDRVEAAAGSSGLIAVLAFWALIIAVIVIDNNDDDNDSNG